MDVIEIIDEIETDNNPINIDGLDYLMNCKVTVNKVRTRCEQVSVVQCDMSKYDGLGIETLLELRRGDWITWIFIDGIDELEVVEMKEWE